MLVVGDLEFGFSGGKVEMIGGLEIGVRRLPWYWQRHGLVWN
jgi:hypothetical protein